MRPHFYLLFMLLLAAAPKTLCAQAGPDTARSVVLHADPKLAVLFVKKHEHGFHGIRGSIHSARGFRVQIYNGNSRTEAQQRKIDFIRRYPNVRSYMSYIAPSYRVKVGDFKSRGDAIRFYSELNSIYRPCMVVPDIVEINTLRDED